MFLFLFRLTFRNMKGTKNCLICNFSCHFGTYFHEELLIATFPFPPELSRCHEDLEDDRKRFEAIIKHYKTAGVILALKSRDFPNYLYTI